MFHLACIAAEINMSTQSAGSALPDKRSLGFLVQKPRHKGHKNNHSEATENHQRNQSVQT